MTRPPRPDKRDDPRDDQRPWGDPEAYLEDLMGPPVPRWKAILIWVATLAAIATLLVGVAQIVAWTLG